MTATELVEAWSAWERWNTTTRRARWRYARGSQPPPGDRVVSARLVSAEIGVALDHGMTHTALHDLIATGRRDGLSVYDSVARALG